MQRVTFLIFFHLLKKRRFFRVDFSILQIARDESLQKFIPQRPQSGRSSRADKRNRSSSFEEFVKLFEHRAIAGDGLNFLFDVVDVQVITSY